MAVEEYGLSPAAKSPILAALNTSAAFILCGLVPLVSYLADVPKVKVTSFPAR
jgi:hypothetical protein